MAELVAVLLSFLKAIGNYRWYAIGISWLVALGGWAYVYSMPDEYQATARVYVDTQSILKPLMASMTTMPNVEQQVMFMRRTLISRPNVERVMRMVDLDIKAGSPREQEEMVDKLMTQIKMGGTERDDIYTISYTSANPKTGKEVVQSLLTIFVEGSFGGKKLDSEKAIQFIDEQIKMYEERLATGENALKEFKIRNMGMLPRQGSDYASGYGELADKLSQAKLEMLETEQARNAIKRQMLGDEMAPVGGAVVAEPANPEIDERIAAVEKQLDTLRLQYTEEHPDIVAAKRLIASLQARKKTEAKTVKPGDPGANYSPMLQQMNVALSVEEAKLASLKARVNEYTARLAQMRLHSNMAPEIEAQLGQLGLDFRRHIAVRAHLRQPRRVFVHARLQRGQLRFLDGQGHVHLLQHGAVVGARVTRLDGLCLGFLARLQRRDQALGGDDVGMLFRILQAQGIELLFDGGDALVDFRIGRLGHDGTAHWRHFVAQHLTLDGVAGLFRFQHLELGLAQLVRQLAIAAGVVATLAGQHAHVADLEFLQRVLARGQAFLVHLDLFVDELDRFFRIELLAAEAALDKDGQQRLHHFLARLRVGAGVGNRVDVVALGAAHFDLGHQLVDHLFLFAR